MAWRMNRHMKQCGVGDMGMSRKSYITRYVRGSQDTMEMNLAEIPNSGKMELEENTSNS